MKNKRYVVFDCYECYISDLWDMKPERLGSADNKSQLIDIINRRDEETDGECYIQIFDRIKREFVYLDSVSD